MCAGVFFGVIEISVAVGALMTEIEESIASGKFFCDVFDARSAGFAVEEGAALLRAALLAVKTRVFQKKFLPSAYARLLG